MNAISPTNPSLFLSSRSAAAFTAPDAAPQPAPRLEDPEAALLQRLEGFIQPLLGTRVDFSAVTAAIRLNLERVTAERGQLLEQSAIEIGIDTAADFQIEQEERAYDEW